MSVDRKVLEAAILESVGDDAELQGILRKKYDADDAAAARFVSGFMRNSDYTQKTQALAEERRAFGDATKTIETLRANLEAADVEKNKVLRDLAANKVDVARARQAIQNIKETYQLTDDDLPGVGDLIQTRVQRTVIDSSDDIDARIKAAVDAAKADMEQRFISGLTPEIGAMASLPIVWSEINREHAELTGKALSYIEQQEILKLARSGADSSLGKGSLMGIWQDKYGITGDDGLRMKKHNESVVADARKKWEADAAAKMSEEALRVVTPGKAEVPSGAGISRAFQTQFRTHAADPLDANSGVNRSGETGVIPLQGGNVNGGGARIPASQRAARTFVEKGGIAGYHPQKKTA